MTATASGVRLTWAANNTGIDTGVAGWVNTTRLPHSSRRACSASSSTSIADLLDQLQCAHTDTLEHQHLALSEIHRVTGHKHLFDTVFVYENYPIDTDALFGTNGLAITEITGREYNHYPLAMVARPGPELGLRVEFDTDVFDAESIERLTKRFKRVLVAMTADPGRQS